MSLCPSSQRWVPALYPPLVLSMSIEGSASQSGLCPMSTEGTARSCNTSWTISVTSCVMRMHPSNRVSAARSLIFSRTPGETIDSETK